MIGRLLLLLAILLVAGPTKAETLVEQPAECRVAQHLLENNIALPKVRKAIAAKHLTILVLGAGSSSLPGPSGPQNAYPGVLRTALAHKLKGVDVVLTADVKSSRTGSEMIKALAADLATSRPTLVVWQTGTVDAVRGVDQDQFSQALDKGVSMARAAGADVVLVNSQYSPRTESIIALSAYSETMRWVAMQHEIPLFDRFTIMKLWGDLGTFDLYSATKKLDIAERVHACIGWLLADLITEAAQPSPDQGGR